MLDEKSIRAALGLTEEQEAEYRKWREKEDKKELRLNAMKIFGIIVIVILFLYISRLS